jgi:methanogenic corrinoid protein MtbC1
MTHSICTACEAKSDIDSFNDSHLEQVRDLSKTIWTATDAFQQPNVEEIIERAVLIGVRDSDLLMALLQPALVEIGRCFEKGVLSVAQERAFSVFATEITERLIDKLPGDEKADQVDVVLACADGNQHQMGIRFLEHGLRERGVRCRSLRPGLPLANLLSLVEQSKPRVLGISVAMDNHLAFVETCRVALKATNIKLVVGGRAAQQVKAGVGMVFSNCLQTEEIFNGIEALLVD